MIRIVSARLPTAVWQVLIAVVLATGMGWLLVSRGALVAFAAVTAAWCVVAVGFALRRPEVPIVTLVGLLAFFPVARLSFGSLPIYFTDVAVAIALVAVRWSRPFPHLGRLRLAIAAYLGLWVVPLAAQVLRLNLVLVPTYGMLRQALAVMSVVLGVWLIAERRWLMTAITALAVGTVATELLAIAQVVPGLRGVVKSVLVSQVPAFAVNGYAVYPRRAFALFTAPPTLAAYLAIVFFLFVGTLPYQRGWRRRLTLGALALMPAALIATYSRGWVFGFAAGLLALACAHARLFRRAVVVAVVAAVVGFVAVAAGALNGSYLTERFSTLGPGDTNVQTRLTRENIYFSWAAHAPVSALVGEGFSEQDLVARNLVAGSAEANLVAGVSDNGYLLEAYSHGLIDTVLLIAVLVSTLVLGMRAARRAEADRWLLSGLSAAIAAMIVLHMEQFFYQAVFMRTLLWLVIGLVLGAIAPKRVTASEPAATVPVKPGRFRDGHGRSVLA